MIEKEKEKRQGKTKMIMGVGDSNRHGLLGFDHHSSSHMPRVGTHSIQPPPPHYTCNCHAILCHLKSNPFCLCFGPKTIGLARFTIPIDSDLR